MRTIRILICSFAVTLVCTASAFADAVTHWNMRAVQAVAAAGTARPGPSGSIDIAMVHAAVYDAVQAIEKDYEPYAANISGASGSSSAAAAKAAHDVLVARFPLQSGTIGGWYTQFLSDNGIAPDDSGVAAGQQAAAAIIALRVGDGAFPSPAPAPFTGNTEIGQWRSASPTGMNPGPWLGAVRPFTLVDPAQFRSDGPPDRTSNQYARDYIEVKAYGVQTGSLRSPEQTDMALFWAGNFTTMMNATLRQVSEAHVTDISESSRLFAMATMATADTVIGTWNEKVHFNFWRPDTAIHNGELDDNPKTIGDTAWRPLIANPPYPDYGSGANGYTASTMYVLERFFGTDEISFTIATTNSPNTSLDVRPFTSFSQVMDEVVDARVFLGIHFRFADVCSRRLGHDVAKFGHQNYFRPVTGKGSQN